MEGETEWQFVCGVLFMDDTGSLCSVFFRNDITVCV